MNENQTKQLQSRTAKAATQVRPQCRNALYVYDKGIDVAQAVGYPFKSPSIAYYILGNALASANGSPCLRYFNPSDSAAIASDWDAVSRDLWRATKAVSDANKAARAIFEVYRKALGTVEKQTVPAHRARQLELFGNER